MYIYIYIYIYIYVLGSYVLGLYGNKNWHIPVRNNAPLKKQIRFLITNGLRPRMSSKRMHLCCSLIDTSRMPLAKPVYTANCLLLLCSSSVLQFVVVCCSSFKCAAVCRGASQCAAVSCSVLQ